MVKTAETKSSEPWFTRELWFKLSLNSLSQLCDAVARKPNFICGCVNRMPSTREVVFPLLLIVKLDLECCIYILEGH